MKKVLIIAFEFPPLGSGGVLRLTKYVKYLREFGWEPVVLTIDENADYGGAKDYSLLEELPHDLEIHRTTYLDFDVLFKKEVQNSTLLKLYHALDLNFPGIFSITKPDKNIIWFPPALEKAQQLASNGDIELIFTDSPPSSTALIGYKIKELFGIPWVADFRDPWSLDDLSYEALADNYHPRGREVDRALEKIILESCDRVIVVSEKLRQGYVDQLGLKSERTEVFSDGYDEYDFQNLPGPRKGDQGIFKIKYMGSFYASYNPTPFLIALKDLITKDGLSDIRLHVIGHGSQWIDHNLGPLNLEQLRPFIELQSHMEAKTCLSEMLNSDLLLVISPSHIDYNVPQKIYYYMRMGAPIFAVLPEHGEAARIIMENEVGYVTGPENIPQIEEKLYALYLQWKDGLLARNQVSDQIKRFEKRTLTRRLAGVFDELVENRRQAIMKNNEEGESFFQKGNIDDALLSFKAALTLNPYCAETLNNIGVVLFSRQEPVAALEYFNRALQIDPLYRDALENGYQANIILNRQKEAEALQTRLASIAEETD